MRRPTPSVCLAVSAFRSDEAVIALLRTASDERSRRLFHHVVVVDSLGSGRIPDVIEAEGWSWVTYLDSPTNLGSAGNLALRLATAAKLGSDYCFAINHDGELNHAVVERLVEFARTRPGLGAAYPLRYLSSRGGFDVTGTQRLPLPARIIRNAPVEPWLRVYWSSSNAALYSLEPVRRGLLPWGDLWMGWEDLEYGWQLDEAGFEQFMVCDARLSDNYEYNATSLLGTQVHVSEKPAWYAYYHPRNLILAARRSGRSPLTRMVVAGRVAQEFVVTTVLRRQKRLRYRLLLDGVVDGLRGRSGKGRLP